MKQLKNFLIKREQSQACLSFAKREKSRLLAKTLLTLVALLAVTTGAWADDTYPIVYDFEAAANALENPGNKNGSAANGQKFYGWEEADDRDNARQDYKGYEYAEGSKLPKVCHVWRRSDRINGNVAGNGGLKCPSNKEMAVDGLTEGLTVTIIYDATNAQDGSKEIVWAIGDGSSESLGEPRAKATINGAEAVPGTTTIKSGDMITVTKVTPAANGSGYIVFAVKKDMVIKKIIVDVAPTGTPVPLTRGTGDKINEWTLTNGMPAGNVTVSVDYFPQAAFAMSTDATPVALAPKASTSARANTDDPLVEGGTVAGIVDGEAVFEEGQGTLLYHFSAKQLDAAALEALTAADWTDKVPTADGLAEGTVYVYYYIKGADDLPGITPGAKFTFSDSDIQELAVTLLPEPTYNVEFAEGTNPEAPAEPIWTADPNADVKKGQTVTVTYTGDRKVIGVKAEKSAPAEEPVTLATPLTMEAQTDGTIKVDISGELSTGMKYAVNGGEKTTITTTTTINVTKGDKVKFYGNGTSTTAYGNNLSVILKGTAKTKVYGNIMSLLDETGYETATTLSSEKVFNGLFQANTNLTDASGLLLPAMTLTSGCYNAMFGGCTSLTAAPALPATTLAPTCYYSMFGGCTSLTAAPELPATTLANACYNQMFRSCTSLTTAPVLPATTLANACYYMMFHTCSSLNSVTCLATDISASSCTNNWLYNVSATGTITTPSATNWTPNSSSGIPSGWTRVNVDN